MSNRLQKKMAKEIHMSQGRYPVKETLQYSDELTTKELLKKYPKRKASKQEQLLASAKKEILIKKKVLNKNLSKRTTPGLIASDSAPAHVHTEGKRWVKTLIKQNLADRTILAHKGSSIGRKK